jgi:membrane protease subunit HflK
VKLLKRLLYVVVALGLVAAYLVGGVFEVAPDEEAAVLRLGRYVRTLGPGLHWRALVLEKIEKRVVTVTQREEFGYRTVDPGPPPKYEDVLEEQRTLTGDENLVNIQFVLQYRILDLSEFLFRVATPEVVIRDVAEASVREIVARRPVDDALTKSRALVALEAQERIQETLDRYGVGVKVQSVQLQDVEPPDQVKAAFAEVNSADQDRERLILEARGYAAEVVPRARGEAEEVLNQARGYRESRVLRSRGEASRFTQLLEEYRKAPEVTRERLYLETLEEVLPRVEIVIIEGAPGESVLPYLPLGRRRGLP